MKRSWRQDLAEGTNADLDVCCASQLPRFLSESVETCHIPSNSASPDCADRVSRSPEHLAIAAREAGVVAMRDVFGVEPEVTCSDASIARAEPGIPVFCTFGLPHDKSHAPNENLDLDQFEARHTPIDSVLASIAGWACQAKLQIDFHPLAMP
jgi:hypothetical protein